MQIALEKSVGSNNEYIEKTGERYVKCDLSYS